MKNDSIIHHKVAELCGHGINKLTALQEQQIESDPELQKELAFIEELWRCEAFTFEQPSQNLDASFYKMLATAQTSSSRPQPTPSWWSRLQNSLTMRPALQLGLLTLVFVIGLSLNSPVEEDPRLHALHQQVASLNTMMAITMLQQSSASERLAGVAYSQNANLQHEQLATLLLDILKNDSAAPVKLAVINTLSRSSIAHLEDQLIAVTQNQSNVLVQIELIRLLISRGSNETVNQLFSELADTALHPDVELLVQQTSMPQGA